MICRTCSEEFEPTSRHRDCPSCRGKAKKISVGNTCDDCGVAVSYKAPRCTKCSVKKKLEGFEYKPVIHNKGYKLIYNPEHPRAFTAGVYVLEHIIVMENVIGRELLPGENVHHKNGVRSDNRPENLELWVSNQPSGQRPEDLVKWAKEIIDLYGDMV